MEPRIDELQGGDCADGHEFVQLDNQQARQKGQGKDTYYAVYKSISDIPEAPVTVGSVISLGIIR